MSYDKLCKRINFEFRKIKKPTYSDLEKLSQKFETDISIIREGIGLKDDYDFNEK